MKKKATEPQFSKADLVRSKRFKGSQDALNVILDENELYTMSQVEALLSSFLNQKEAK